MIQTTAGSSTLSHIHTENQQHSLLTITHTVWLYLDQTAGYI